MLKRLIIVFFLLAVIACSSSKTALKPDPGSGNEQQEKAAAEKLRSGYNLFVENCGGCHFLPVPSSKNKTEWDKLLPEMFSKTQLDENQQQLIKLYIYSKL